MPCNESIFFFVLQLLDFTRTKRTASFHYSCCWNYSGKREGTSVITRQTNRKKKQTSVLASSFKDILLLTISLFRCFYVKTKIMGWDDDLNCGIRLFLTIIHRSGGE